MRLSSRAAVCILVLVSASARVAAQQRTAPGNAARQPAVAAEPAPPAKTWNTEQEWIVADVATAIQQLVALAQGPTAGTGPVTVRAVEPRAGALAAFDVTVPGGQHVPVAITDHLWAPAAFAPLTSGLSRPTQACTYEPGTAFLRALLTPTAEGLARENGRISGWLQSDVRCADAHIEAALLLGTMALREAAGGFSDSRRLISRMTAHLAAADATSAGNPPVERRLADALLLTLVERQQSALEALTALESSSKTPEIQAWVRALRLRNTADWRLLSDRAQATMLEQFALLRALDTSLGDEAGLELFDALDRPAEVPDWGRLLLQDGATVESGHRFAEYWIAAELVEISQVLIEMDASKAMASAGAVMRELNVEPAAGPVSPGGIVQVIDAGTWAAAAQRHLMRALVGRHRHLVGAVGLKDDARVFRDEVQRTFSGLRLFPLAMIAIGDRAEITRVHAQAVALVKTRPELITDWMWKELGDKAASAALDPPAPPATWFTPFLPAGTAFDAGFRTESGSKEPRFTESQIAELRRRAPYSLRLVNEALRWKGDKPSHATLKREYGAIADYNLGVAKGLAVSAWDQPEIYIPQMEFVCRMSTDAYWDLAPYLADHGRTADARRAYEQWLEKGRNQVAISNGVDWLVRHYFEKGEIDKANAVANRVADVHSFWGLVTRANLHEWLGDLEAAERVHRTAWRRYDNPNELLAFYLRHNRTGSDVDELMTKVFPNGLMRTAAPAAATPPLDGVVIVFAGMTGFEGGLRAGDVITAVDGIRVKNFPQYRAARGASDADQMRFTIWRDGVYKDVAAPLRHRWIVSTLRTYEPRSGQ